jgi:hypothetical protein
MIDELTLEKTLLTDDDGEEPVYLATYGKSSAYFIRESGEWFYSSLCESEVNCEFPHEVFMCDELFEQAYRGLNQ